MNKAILTLADFLEATYSPEILRRAISGIGLCKGNKESLFCNFMLTFGVAYETMNSGNFYNL